jgi:hypothetical protein
MFNVLRRGDSEDSFESEKGLVVHETRAVYCQEYRISGDVKTDKRHQRVNGKKRDKQASCLIRGILGFGSWVR